MTAKKTTTKKRQIKPVSKPKNTNKRTWSIVAIVAVLALLGGFFFYWLITGGGMIEQTKMSTYLNDKYGKEFTVSNIRKEGSGLGVRGEIVGDARPVDDKSLVFEVSSQSDGYRDQYVAAVWQKVENTKLQALADKQPIASKAYSKIYINGPPESEIKGTAIPELNTLSETYRAYTTYDIRVKPSELYDAQKKSEYIAMFKVFVQYFASLGKFSSSSGASMSIPTDSKYVYNAGVTISNYQDFLNDENPTFDKYFKYVIIGE